MNTQTQILIFALVVMTGMVTLGVAETYFIANQVEGKSATGECASSFKNSAAQFCQRIT